VRNFITKNSNIDTLYSTQPITLEGVTFDDGSSMKNIYISIDCGITWFTSTLGESLGRFSFRA
jgi:hypothetical protein